MAVAMCLGQHACQLECTRHWIRGSTVTRRAGELVLVAVVVVVLLLLAVAAAGGERGVDGACTSPIDRGALRWGQESRTQTTSFPESRYMTSGSPHSRVEKTSSTPSCSEYAAAYLPAGKVSVGQFVP